MPITHNTPQHNFFVYAAPFPEKSNRFELIEDNPETDFILNGQACKARVIDYMDYTLNNISDYHARWAYGISGNQLAKQLQKKYPQLIAESRVVLYLFEKVGSQRDY